MNQFFTNFSHPYFFPLVVLNLNTLNTTLYKQIIICLVIRWIVWHIPIIILFKYSLYLSSLILSWITIGIPGKPFSLATGY
ncbi:MAG: hypothetical protein Ta2E_01110 [Mycoplasmoidaceae bacterium]|nr:MAG: hypothetical protein Ta2E_01110 [Mycoplasmoidaceae bacterium]